MWAEVLFPGPQLAMPISVDEIPERVIHTIAAWRGVEGLRRWTELQSCFADANRRHHFVWSLERHLDGLGYPSHSVRDLAICKAAVEAVTELTRIEIAIYHPNGQFRLRGPVIGVAGHGRQHPEDPWLSVEMEFFIHETFHAGIADSTGVVRPLWSPGPRSLLTLDPKTGMRSLTLGLVLPLLWMRQPAPSDGVTLSGARLLGCAGATIGARNPTRVWNELREDLDALVRVRALGGYSWHPDAPWSLQGQCTLRPPV